MTTDAAAHLEKILAAVERVRALENAIAVMALITPGLNVLLVIHRPQPVLVSAVSFFNRRRAAPVPSVTRRTTESIGIVNLQQVAIRVRDESLFVPHIFLRE